MESKIRRIWIGLIVAVFVTVLAFVSVGCAANTYTVCPGGCNYTSIQAAIDDATSGDIIKVYSGTYYENVDVNKQLILRGNDTGDGQPVVDARGNGSAITLNANGITVDSFSAINASSWPMAGILVHSHNNIVINSTASSNAIGIYLYVSSNNTLTGNSASHNSNYGIYLPGSDYNTLMSNTASNNGISIYLYYSSNNTLSGNTVSNNSNDGIYLDSSRNNTLIGNTASSNNYGIYLKSSSNNTLTSNTASNNSFGIRLRSSSNNNTIYNNYFNNTNNAWDDGTNIWNITKTAGTNIIGGPFLGGNYWSDYAGEDTDGDGLGDTLLPYISRTNIIIGGDWLPLVKAAEPPERWDINEDCTVNFIDLTILSAHWLETTTAPYPRYDINEDGNVNFIDLTILSAHWLETTC